MPDDQITGAGLALLSALRRSGSRSALFEVPETYLTPVEHRALVALRTWVVTHNAFPTPRTFAELVGTVSIVTNEPLSHYIDQVRKRTAYNSMLSPFGALREALESRDPDAAADQARLIVQTHAQLSARQTGVVEIAHAMSMVESDYNVALRNPGLRGIPTGWATVDEATGGWQNADIVSIVGRPGAGKTYVLLKSAYEAWRAGRSVLFMSNELAALQLARRLIGIHTGINPDDIRKGRLPTYLHRQMLAGMRSMDNGVPFTVVVGSFRKSVSSFRGLMEEYCPDIGFVDASYLMQPDKKRAGSGGRRESVSDVIEELKIVSTDLDRPIVQSLQFNRTAKKQSPREAREADADNSAGQDKNPIAHLSLDKIGETDVAGQVSSVAIGLERYDEPYENTRRYMGFLKGREGETGWWAINYRFKPQVDFSEIPKHQLRTGVQRANVDWMA